MTELEKKYTAEILPELQKQFSITNIMAVPKLEKITINVGVGRAGGDKKIIEGVVNTLARITGQAPVKVKSRKSISNFKLRAGMIVGVMTTLRGDQMYEFMYRLVNITLPRVRDFQGINPKSIDEHGNLNIGFKEHIVFPEIKFDEVEHLHGLEVSITTTANNREQGKRLLELLGMPFKKSSSENN